MVIGTRPRPRAGGPVPGPRVPPPSRAPWLAAGAAAVVVGSLVVAHLVDATAGRVLHDRMLPWIVGRGLGVAAYLALTALAGLGLWFRHPWRRGSRALLRPATVLRAHAALAAATAVLVTGHVVVLALDAYAHVGWAGAFVPGLAHYRPAAVALGTVALELGVLVGASAALAGRLVGRHWLAVHRLAVVAFACAWLHGIEAGSDVASLRWLYLSSGVLVTTLAVSRATARRAERRLENAS